MDTLGAFGTSLWSVIDRATDPNTHPKASGENTLGAARTRAESTCFPLPSLTRSATRLWSEALTRGGGATAAEAGTPRVPARKPGLTGNGGSSSGFG